MVPRLHRSLATATGKAANGGARVGRRLAVLVAIAALAGAGCTDASAPGGDTTVSGQTVQRTLLDPGNYPTKPRPALGAAGSVGVGRLIEGRRLADHVVAPFEVDASLIGPMPMVTLPIASPDILSRVFPDPVRAGAGGRQFVAGFVTARYGSSGTLFNVVLRFSTVGDAAAAAAEMVALSRKPPPGATDASTSKRPTVIPRHPDTQAVASNRPDPEVFGYTAHGPYVLCQRALVKTDVGAAADLIATTLDKQQPLIDGFIPTAPDRLADLPVDPTGLLARTLVSPPDLFSTADGYYGPRGALHFQADPLASDAIFASAPVLAVALGMTGVYRTPDATAAKRVSEGFGAAMTSVGYTPAPDIRGMPQALCLSKVDASPGNAWPRFYCVSPAAEYAIEATSEHQTDAQQQLAAQYLTLTTN